MKKMQNPFTEPRWAWITVLVLHVIHVLCLPFLLLVCVLCGLAWGQAPPVTEPADLLEPAGVLAVATYPLWLILLDVRTWFLLAEARRKTAVAVAVVMTLPLIIFPLALFGVFRFILELATG